jgi:hypothetical protein
MKIAFFTIFFWGGLNPFSFAFPHSFSLSVWLAFSLALSLSHPLSLQFVQELRQGFSTSTCGRFGAEIENVRCRCGEIGDLDFFPPIISPRRPPPLTDLVSLRETNGTMMVYGGREWVYLYFQLCKNEFY